jgi:hypothetical protein
LSILTIIFAHSLIPATDCASAAQVTVAWDPDTSPGLAGYKVYWGTVSRNYSWTADTSTQTTYAVPSLSEGATYYFAATAYDAAHTESGPSNEIMYTVPSACTYTISPAGQSFGAGGGTAGTNVATGVACNWTASNSASWISITSGGSGKGNGAVAYSVAANTGTAARMAGLTIAGRTFTISQAGVQTYSLSISTSGSGSGTVTSSPTGTIFNAGTSVTLTATPGASSIFAGWSGACSGTSSSCTVAMNSNLSVTAAFNLRTYAITASAGTGGSVSPLGSISVNSGGSQTFTITPTIGYTIADVKVDGASVGAVSSYSFLSVAANHTIQASFTQPQITYTLTITKGGAGSGTVTSSPTGTIFNAGTSVTLTATPGANSTFAGWSGACSGTSSSCTVTMNSNASVAATFALKSYAITASTGTGGSISPTGSVNVNQGASQGFTISPNSGYTIADVKADGISVGPVASYTFSNVSANHTIAAAFAANTCTLSTTKTGTGTGTVTNSPSGTTFAQGTQVTLTATAGASSIFGGMLGDSNHLHCYHELQPERHRSLQRSGIYNHSQRRDGRVYLAARIY